MDAVSYIKEQLDIWKNEFTDIEIRYSFDIGANFHMIEIGPEDIRRGNKKYEEQELNFLVRIPS